MKTFLFLSIVSTFFLLHFEGARTVLFSVPVYFVEIGVIASTVGFFLIRKQSKASFGNTPSVETQNFAPLRKGIFFLLVGIVSSLIVATLPSAICPLSHEGLLRALGIVKSWFVFPIVFGYIFFHASHTYFSREKLILAFLISFLPILILSFLGWLFGTGMTYDSRLSGIFNSPNILALHFTPAIILSWYFFRTSKFSILHSPFSILPLLFLFLLFLTRSVSAWIAVGVGILFFEIMRTRIVRVGANNYSPLRHGRGYIAIFLVCTGIFFLSQWNNPRFENFFDPDSRSSFASRLMIWQSAGKMISDSPIFGIGPGNFGSCYLTYQQYFPPYLEWSVPEPHNVFLAFWLGSGLIGLLGFGFLVAWWFRNVFRRMQKEGDLLLLALAVIMIATLIHGLFDTTYWRMILAYSFWVVFFLGIRGKNDT